MQVYHCPKIKVYLKGFTLIELIVVIGIIAGLVALVLPRMNAFQDYQKVDDAAEQIQSHIRLAQNNALTGAKCTSGRAKKWSLVFTSDKDYKIQPECDSGVAEPFTAYTLPAGVAITNIAVGTCAGTDDYAVSFENISGKTSYSTNTGPCTTGEIKYTITSNVVPTNQTAVVVPQGGNIIVNKELAVAVVIPTTVPGSTPVPTATPAPQSVWVYQYQWGTPAPGYDMSEMPAYFTGWMNVRFRNEGSSQINNLVATLDSVPPNVQIIDGDVTVGSIPAGGSAWSTDVFKKKVDMAHPVDSCWGVTWKVEYDDALGHQVFNRVPEFPPGEEPGGCTITLTATAGGSGVVDTAWAWTAGKYNPDGFEVCYSENKYPSYPVDTCVHKSSPTDTTHQFTGLTSGKIYHFRVGVYKTGFGVIHYSIDDSATVL